MRNFDEKLASGFPERQSEKQSGKQPEKQSYKLASAPVFFPGSGTGQTPNSNRSNSAGYPNCSDPDQPFPLCDIEAEQIILGKLIMNNDCLDKYPMKSSYFSEEAHRRVFEFILSQRNNNITADSVTLKNFFNTDEILRQIGGSNYLSIMLVVSTGILDYVSYCKLLQDFYIKRQFKELLLNHLKEVENLKLNSDTLLKNCMDEMQQLRESNVNFSFGYEKLEEIDNKLENATDSYVKTGLIDFDKEILGIPRGNLTVLGGRPSMGKSTLALNIACNMAKNGNRICFFSAEMSKAELYVKILSRLTSIDNRRISQNNLSGYEIERIEETKKNLKIPLFIDDRTFVDTDYIKQGILNFRRRNKGIDCVFIDHLHLLKDRHNRPLAKLAFAKICQDIKNF